MATEAEQLSDVNKRHRQKMLLLKNRAQTMFRKVNPTAVNLVAMLSPAQPKQLTTLYQHQWEPQQHERKHLSGNKAQENVSTLLRGSVKREGEYTVQSNNISIESLQAVHSIGWQTEEPLKNSNLLNRIDELLNNRSKEKEKTGIANIYDQYLEKSSFNYSHSLPNNTTISPKLSNADSGKNSISDITAMLRTIQQQKDKQEQKKQQKGHQPKTLKHPIKQEEGPPTAKWMPPKMPSSSANAIQRQKKKLQQTMKQMKKEQQSLDNHDRSSLVLELSDDSQNEETETNGKWSPNLKDNKRKNQAKDKEEIKRVTINTAKQPNQENRKEMHQQVRNVKNNEHNQKESQSQKTNEYHNKIEGLKAERLRLTEQLKAVQSQLDKLEKEEEEDQ